ncbi:ABC transporter ATP-binding protein/permease [Chelatococcus reniformis]|uniref:ATP-binding protein n=1 Tax=Chelatococcus reniformis TaxID=1494448 RepID=A0A916URW8_9HYPH|nr:ABC transporter ATP-binding protein/permease [Chelatococcus reniformis]GGC83938.1 ATP-binding protein [Chelatococcus reniformis]
MNALKQALADIWRLIWPYFVSREPTEVRIWPFGTFRTQERVVGLALVIVVIAIEFAQVAINVRLSYFSRDWFNAIQNKDAASFWTLLFTVFVVWAVIYIASAIYQYALQSYLRIRWRRFLTRHFIDRWLDDNAHYHMQLFGQGADNPDQRIQEDIDSFIMRTQSLTLGILSSVTTLFSFSVVLWELSADFTVPGTDWRIPGFLVWGALIYSVLATWLTHKIGRPLIRLNFEQQHYEADFRFSLARLREYAEQVALIGGTGAEKERLGQRFANVIGNFYAIVSRTKKLTAFTSGYSQVNAVIPYVLVAPYYFANKITLGGMQQTAGAFARVESTLSFFVSAYSTIADYKAVVDRLNTFDAALNRVLALHRREPRILRAAAEQGRLAVEDLELRLPSGTPIVRVPHLRFEPGEAALLTGPSGSGKSTLFRAIAGIWPFGEGRVLLPEDRSVLLLPQRPYIPIGPLRGAVAYPAASDAFDDGRIREALGTAHLRHLVGRLDEEGHWAQTLSLGEQQRLAVARALLARPDWLFLDEATAALDEGLEEMIYRLIGEHLPATTVVSIGHRSTLRAFHGRRIDMEADETGVFVPRDVKAVVA